MNLTNLTFLQFWLPSVFLWFIHEFMKFYIPDFPNNVLKVYSSKGELLEKKILKNLTNLEIVGIVCTHVASGKSVKDIAKGGKEEWQIEYSTFQMWVASDNIMKKMYEKAKASRIHALTEKCLIAEDAAEVKKLKDIIVALKLTVDQGVLNEKVKPVRWLDSDEYRRIKRMEDETQSFDEVHRSSDTTEN